MARLLRLLALPAALLVAGVARGEVGACSVGVSQETAQRLFAILNHPPAESGCKFEGVSTQRDHLEVTWSRDGMLLPALRVVVSDCDATAAVSGAPFVVEIPPEIGRGCPSVLPRIDELTKQLSAEVPAGNSGSLDDPLFRAARVVFVAVFVMVVLLLGRASSTNCYSGRTPVVETTGYPKPSLLAQAPRPTISPSWAGSRPGATWLRVAGEFIRRCQSSKWWAKPLGRATQSGAIASNQLVLGLASFSAALTLRAALPFSLGNWYSEVLPAAGPPPYMRFGPGFFAFQSLWRDLGLWDAGALVWSQLVLGAVALPLLLGVLRELRVGLYASAAALVLLVFAPFHARLSASSCEHLLASTLCLGLLLAWLRAARDGDRLWLALVLLLFPAVCLTRVDMSIQALLVLPWPLLRDRVERAGSDGSHSWRRVAFLGVVAFATVLASYRLIAVPAKHPLPELEAQIGTLRYVFRQYWLLATNFPYWMPLSTVVLAAVGAVAMLVRRPLLLVRVVVTLVAAFVGLARTFLPDELLAARYFLFTIPIFLIVSGLGFEALCLVVPRRYRALAAAFGVVALAAWSAGESRSAYAYRYAFQDEYSFLQTSLASLPAGCTVYQVPIRADAFPLDLDCCLEAPRSPLRLDFPQLNFRQLPDATAAVFGGPGCVAYYESIACQIEDDPESFAVHHRADKAADYLHRRCAEVRRLGHLQPLAETTVSPHATVDFFHGRRPRAGLYAWTP